MINKESFSDDFYMKKALAEAAKAQEEGEIPVGAVIVVNDVIIGKGHNQTEKLNDVTAHAEMLAITAASNYMGAKYLEQATLYVTLEPCPMCASAIKSARISRLIYAADDPKNGYHLFSPSLLSNKIVVKSHVLMDESSKLLRNFFKSKRK